METDGHQAVTGPARPAEVNRPGADATHARRIRKATTPALPANRGTAITAGRDPEVVDDLPDAIPVVGGELDAVETYLGAVLDELFAGLGKVGRAVLARVQTAARMDTGEVSA